MRMVSEQGSKIPIGIPEFYKGRSVFLTGFTGALGKLVVEKLLYSCPDLNKIYILVRPKKGQTPQERVKLVTDLLAYDRVREKYPGSIESKVCALQGDMLSDRLGLSTEDQELLRREVSVIIHGAASVRFDDSLRDAFRQNTVGTKMMLDLAVTIPKLVSLVYISTAYTNCDKFYIKEQLYPPKADWKKTFDICEKIDPATLQILSEKYIDMMPNTYTFSKNISEHVINDHRNQLPVIIVRPSIVVGSVKEPVAGWCDNKYGPIALVLGFLMGIVRCSWVDVTKQCNYIYSDVVVNSIIVASWKRGLIDTPVQDVVEIYNACSPEKTNMNHKDFSLIYKREDMEGDLINQGINFVSLMFVKEEFWFRINMLYRHVLPAAIVDLVLVAMKKKPMLLSIRRKVFIATLALAYFTKRTFQFENTKFIRIPEELTAEDREVFGWDFDKYDFRDSYRSTFRLGRYILLKPLYDDFEANKRRLKWLYIIDRFAVYLTYSVVALLMYAFSVPQAICSLFHSLVYF